MSGYEILVPPDEIFLYRTEELKKKKEFNFLFCSAKPEYPEEGGIHVFISGRKYPTNGYPFEEIVRAVDNLKRVVISGTRLLAAKPIRYFLVILAILPKKILLSLFDNIIDELERMSSRMINWWILRPERYCTSGREIYRVGEEMIREKLPEKKHKRWISLLNNFCMMWEFDNYYRWMGQDIFGEINLEKLLENPTKEIMRMFGILMDRTMQDGLLPKWRAIRFLLFWSLATKGWIREFIKEFFKKIDLEKLKMDKSDIYYSYQKTGYNFGGKNPQERALISENI